MLCVAVCCSMLQYVAACCSVLPPSQAPNRVFGHMERKKEWKKEAHGMCVCVCVCVCVCACTCVCIDTGLICGAWAQMCRKVWKSVKMSGKCWNVWKSAELCGKVRKMCKDTWKFVDWMQRGYLVFNIWYISKNPRCSRSTPSCYFTHCNYCNTLQHAALRCNKNATGGNTKQHTATHCCPRNTLSLFIRRIRWMWDGKMDLLIVRWEDGFADCEMSVTRRISLGLFWFWSVSFHVCTTLF